MITVKDFLSLVGPLSDTTVVEFFGSGECFIVLNEVCSVSEAVQYFGDYIVNRVRIDRVDDFLSIDRMSIYINVK